MMADNVPINDQIHHFQNLVQEIHRGGSTLDENYEVSYLVDKLSLLWINFGRDIRRTQGNLTLRSIIQTIRIKDQYRIKSRRKTK